MRNNILKGLLLCNCVINILNSDGMQKSTEQDVLITNDDDQPRKRIIDIPLPEEKRKLSAPNISTAEIIKNIVENKPNNELYLKRYKQMRKLINDAKGKDTKTFVKLIATLLHYKVADLYPKIYNDIWNKQSYWNAHFNDDFTFCNNFFPTQDYNNSFNE